MMYRDLLAAEALEAYAAALNARARSLGAGGRLTASQLRERILASAGRCEWCARDLVAADFELDHVISLNAGGSHVPGNLVVACPDCNRRKGQKHPARFAAEIHNETKVSTPLIQLIFRHYDLEPTQQLSLFDAGADRAAQFIESQASFLETPS